MTRQIADFEVFEVHGNAGYGNSTTFLRAYTTYDKALVGKIKSRTSATFRKDETGRGYWSIAADSRYADAFRAIMTEAASKAAKPAIVTSSNLAYHMYNPNGTLYG